MRVLAIPDVHGHIKMFDQATQILESGQADYAIQMGDLVDDWGQQYNLNHYRDTMERAMAFHKKFPQTVWLWGNHDIGYMYPEMGRKESGHSTLAETDMRDYLQRIEQAGITHKIIHIVDDVIFTHAGLTQEWVDRQKVLVEIKGSLSDEQLFRLVNYVAPVELWQENSPIWSRMCWQNDQTPYSWRGLQVVGHTPVDIVFEEKKVVYTDVFSTYSNGIPIGEEKMIIVDTKKGEWYYAKES